MDCSSELGVIAAGAGALPGARRRCEAGKRTHGPGTRACLALLAATALLALAAPAQAQTEIWSATLTPARPAPSAGLLQTSPTGDAATPPSSPKTLHATTPLTTPSGSYCSGLPSTPLGTTSLAFADATSLQDGRLSCQRPLLDRRHRRQRQAHLPPRPARPPGWPHRHGQFQIDLAWTAPASTGGSAITGYKIEVSPDGSSSRRRHPSTATTYARRRHHPPHRSPPSTPWATPPAPTISPPRPTRSRRPSNTEQPDGSVTTLSSNYFAQQFQTGRMWEATRSRRSWSALHCLL